ncbi:glucose-1-phosphate adenylyltransferase [Oceanobacillus senegalensis]|uniref:glucose-1-phosphate adenylyltransferase n=1 Tax=Oceanobacillus senegalensis TaxID=1936063 RepID=UPI002481E7F4|nr:glucose-1-phosphate adenylyltransferase [Oceanobacillus senegalensis]
MKECVGMLLAGGEGKRLGALTHDIAKPAVPFGGKYRIIDYTLSNCTNSNIQTLGVLTQYSPLELNKHIGNGKPWDMDRRDGGVTILSPYTAKTGGDWFTGTADAIYQNIHFINQYNPKYVLVISGDHIYQMDYRKLLNQHKQSNADATISVIEVPWEEASRFGILNTTDNLRIYEFEEKPEQPQNNLASMGIYIFTWETLKAYLLKDASQQTSSHDFGKDIIPAMLRDERRLYAYRFDGYWKDVGTVKSYWEANMDLLDDNEWGRTLMDKNWMVYTNDSNFPPEFIGENASIQRSLTNSGCFIYGEVQNSILFKGVKVESGCSINESIIHPNVTIGRNSNLERVIVMENTTVPEGTNIHAKDNEEPIVLNQEILEGMKAMTGGEK